MWGSFVSELLILSGISSRPMRWKNRTATILNVAHSEQFVPLWFWRIQDMSQDNRIAADDQ